MISCNRVLEADEKLILCTIIADLDLRSIDIDDFPWTLRNDLRAGITNKLSLDPCTYNRSFWTEERNSLTHHVRSHECTVSIIVLQERNQRSCNRSNLRWRNVHQMYITRCYDREIGLFTSLDSIADKATFLIKRSVTLSNDQVFFFLCGIILQRFIREINTTILNSTIRRSDKPEIIDLSINTERGDQTDIRSFRRLNRTETTIVRIVYVTNLEARTFT